MSRHDIILCNFVYENCGPKYRDKIALEIISLIIVSDFAEGLNVRT